MTNKSDSLCYYYATYEFQRESTLCSLPECQGTPCSKQASNLVAVLNKSS